MMRILLILSALVGLIGSAPGCATRAVILDSQADVVRLGPDVRGRIYVWRSNAWQLVGKTKLPEGWYAGPGPQ